MNLVMCWWCGKKWPEASPEVVKDGDTSWMCQDRNACGVRALHSRWGESSC